MERDPLLATKSWTEDGRRYDMKVTGGVHYIRGNSKPYFSITADIRENGRDYMGGCCHGEIAKRFPDRFTDLIALHLSDIDGAPMHAEGNGWYQFAGACPNALGERYHAGNSKRNFPRAEIDPARPWDTTEYREPTAAECLASFAEHCRITLAEAASLRERALAAGRRETPNGDYYVPAEVRAVVRAACEAMRPRWKQEAEACIAKHSLKLYGDEWKGAA